jgi:hypothetical protein
MNIEKKSTKVKGYKKHHEFVVEKSTLCGHSLVTLKKNGNPILKCTPEEFVKFKALICD